MIFTGQVRKSYHGYIWYSALMQSFDSSRHSKRISYWTNKISYLAFLLRWISGYRSHLLSLLFVVFQIYLSMIPVSSWTRALIMGILSDHFYSGWWGIYPSEEKFLYTILRNLCINFVTDIQYKESFYTPDAFTLYLLYRYPLIRADPGLSSRKSDPCHSYIDETRRIISRDSPLSGKKNHIHW